MNSGDAQPLDPRHSVVKVPAGMTTLMKFLEWAPHTRWWAARLRRERLQWIESLSRSGSGS